MNKKNQNLLMLLLGVAPIPILVILFKNNQTLLTRIAEAIIIIGCLILLTCSIISIIKSKKKQ